MFVPNLPGVFGRCQVEYQQRDAAARGGADAQKKLHSFVLFLGELYLNLEVNQGAFIFKKKKPPDLPLTTRVPAEL